MNDIICAIATPIGMAGVSIIRISGAGSIKEINKYCKGNKLLSVNYNTINLYNIEFNEIYYDQVLISKFQEGKSFTGEEIVEINCHGGMYNTNKILELLLTNNYIRLAEPGEFSKRAFLNGKLSLNKAQGIMDLISSHNEVTHQMSIKSFDGSNLTDLKYIYDEIMNLITKIDVNIDYPEYLDNPNIFVDEIKNSILESKVIIENIIRNTQCGEIYKEGIDCAIIGRPNVGKSTLLNLLSQSNKAIISDIEGTTRDVIESVVVLGDLKLNLMDTAGIRETEDEIENIGIKRSFEIIDKSQFIIYIVDSANPFLEKDVEILETIKDKQHIILNNKVDVGKSKAFENSIDVVLKDNSSLEIIENEIKKAMNLDSFDPKKDNFVNDVNQLMKLKNIKISLSELLMDLDNYITIDMIEISLKDVLYDLGDLLGIEAKHDIINEMFGRFCLGK